MRIHSCPVLNFGKLTCVDRNHLDYLPFSLEYRLCKTVGKSMFVLVYSCRFLLGGDHGRLKFIPPDDFSPLVESLLPQQILQIEPCFYFGNLNKRILAGPLFVEDDTAFVPVPVDTSTVS